MTSKSMGQFISALRRANGMTQQEVADRLNVSNKAVSRWERDACAPDISLIPALAEMMGVSCDELLKGGRIMDAAAEQKSAPKVEKQLQQMVKSELSNLSLLMVLSMLFSISGYIFTLGVSYTVHSGIIGFMVMLAFGFGATSLALIARYKAKQKREGNELFELADEKLVKTFDKKLFHLSYTAFYLIIFALILSFPLLFDPIIYDDVVADFKDYALKLLLPTMAVIVPLYFLLKSYLLSNMQASIEEKKRRKTAGRMDFLHLCIFVVGLAALIVVRYIMRNGHAKSMDFWLYLSYDGFVLFAGSILAFAAFYWLAKNERKYLIFSGLRNIVLTIFAFRIFREEVYFARYQGQPFSWLYFEIEKLVPQLGAFIALYVASELLLRQWARRKKKTNPRTDENQISNG